MKPFGTGNRLKRRGRMGCAGGFSLVELMAVLGVLAVLMGLLLPALMSARRHARRTECVGRQKQWAMAFRMYTEENEGWIPREGYDLGGVVWRNNWAQIINSQSRDVWYNALPEAYLGVPSASQYAYPSARRPFYMRASFFHCPAASFPKEIADPVHGIAAFSIAMNSQLIQPPEVRSVRFSRILRPSRTVLYMDNLLDDEAPVVKEQSRTELGQPSASVDRFAGRRHGDSGVVGLADGSVQVKIGSQVVASSGMHAGYLVTQSCGIDWEWE